MKYLIGASFAFIALGIFSGKEIHESGEVIDLSYAAHNPALVVFSSAMAVFIVVVAQVLKKEPKDGFWAIAFMAMGCIYSLAGGLSAFIYAGALTPISMLVISVGAGSSFGLLVASAVFKRRHLNK